MGKERTQPQKVLFETFRKPTVEDSLLGRRS
jgi:hypothetical protein